MRVLALVQGVGDGHSSEESVEPLDESGGSHAGNEELIGLEPQADDVSSSEFRRSVSVRFRASVTLVCMVLWK